MERTLTVERLFNMGQFANLRFSHTLTNIPQQVALDKEAMKLLEYLMLLDVEYDYRRYLILIEQITTTEPNKVLDLIEGERTTAFEQLFARTKQLTGD